MNFEGYIRIFNREESAYNFDFLFSKTNFQNELEIFSKLDLENNLTVKTNIRISEYTDYYVKMSLKENNLYYINRAKRVKNNDINIIKSADLIEKLNLNKTNELEFLTSKLIVEKPISVRAYNVGHGNMNTIHFSNDEILLYDQGSLDCFNNLFMDYNTTDVKTIIISHFDLDHYNIMIQNCFNNLEKIIIPNDNIPLKLAFFISDHKFADIATLKLAKSRSIKPHSDISSEIQLFTGPNGTNINNRGIILNFIYNDKLFSFTGDIKFYLAAKTYNYTFRYFSHKKYSLVVPHHGGTMGTSKPLIAGIGDIAVYSYGTKYSLPLADTESVINHYKFYIKKTEKLTQGNYRFL